MATNKPLKFKPAPRIVKADAECPVAKLAREAAELIRARECVDPEDQSLMSLVDCTRQLGGTGRKHAEQITAELTRRLVAIEATALHQTCQSQLGAAFHLLLGLRDPVDVMPARDMEAYDALPDETRDLIERRVEASTRMAWSAYQFLMPSGRRDEVVDPDQKTLEDYYGQGGCTLNNSIDSFVRCAQRKLGGA